jgi:hypothetical protein
VRTGRLAQMGSTLLLLAATAACSGKAAASSPVAPSRDGVATTSPIPTPGPTASPTASPRPMAPATIKPGPAMTQARSGQAAARLADGRVLIIGGIVPFTGTCEMACTDPATANVEIYNPNTGKFNSDGSLAGPRSNGQALLLNDGRVLVSGGTGEYGQDLVTLDLYDPGRGTSVVVDSPADIPLPNDAAVVLLADGRVLLAGGSYALDTTSNVTVIFDPTSRGFSTGPLMAEARKGAVATLLPDGRVLLVGGEGSAGNYDSAEVIDPSQPLSQPMLVTSQAYPETSTLLSDGRVLVTEAVPNSSAGCGTPAVSEVFDPRTEMFTPLGPMSTPRTESTAIKIPDGRVLFFGGMDSNCGAVDTVEAFDPGSGTFHVIATGFPKIGDITATLLDDGEILITGADSRYGPTTTTWLIKP